MSNPTAVLDEEVRAIDPGTKLYELRVLLCPEEEGGYSIISLNLPGVISEGDTVQECLTNISEAFRGAVAAYEESGATIPWGEQTVEEAPMGSRELWICVNA